METIKHDALVTMLDRLKLTEIRDQLDTPQDEAARSDMTLREALGFLVSREIARRDERRIEMATKLAQFPFVRELEGFEWGAQPSVEQRQIRELATCRWIAHGDALLFLGPPGTGKTHLAVRLGARRSGTTTASSSSRRRHWWPHRPRPVATAGSTNS